MPNHSSLTLVDPSLYINRELSWLEFNERVLEEVQDSRNPLLERVKFLCIVASNLDEFFEIRVAGVKQQHLSNLGAPEPDALSPSEQLAGISARVRKMVDDEYRPWSRTMSSFCATTSLPKKRSSTTRSTSSSQCTRS